MITELLLFGVIDPVWQVVVADAQLLFELKTSAGDVASPLKQAIATQEKVLVPLIVTVVVLLMLAFAAYAIA